MKTEIVGELTQEKEYHCGSIADKYTKRIYTNQLNQKVIKVFYRCRNCLSRISEDFIPELDKMKLVNVLDLLSNHTSNNN